MEDLLQSQIKESCKLALPDGLKELMCDISREVLRAQPNDLYSFIADYLSALLVTRENMSVVTRMCHETCAGCCLPELEDEFRYLGLDEEGAASAKNIILEYFNRDEDTMNEGNLITKLMKKTSLDVNMLPQIQTAVRHAFQKHQANHTVIYETSSESDKDDAERAASHTIQLYRKTNPTNDDLNMKAAKIQAAYRAYGVRRNYGKRQKQTPKISETIQKNITFESSINVDEPIVTATSYENHKKCSIISVSSISLAGSYLHLPQHKPYSVHESDHSLSDVREENRVILEKEHKIDYSVEKLHKVTELNEERKVTAKYMTEDSEEDLRYEIEERATAAAIDSDESIHEFINEGFKNVSGSEENVTCDI